MCMGDEYICHVPAITTVDHLIQYKNNNDTSLQRYASTMNLFVVSWRDVTWHDMNGRDMSII